MDKQQYLDLCNKMLGGNAQAMAAWQRRQDNKDLISKDMDPAQQMALQEVKLRDQAVFENTKNPNELWFLGRLSELTDAKDEALNYYRQAMENGSVEAVVALAKLSQDIQIAG